MKMMLAIVNSILLKFDAALTCNMSAMSLLRSSSKSSSRGNVQTLSPHFSPARIISEENSFLLVNAPIYRFDKLLMQVPVRVKTEVEDVKIWGSVHRTVVRQRITAMANMGTHQE